MVLVLRIVVFLPLSELLAGRRPSRREHWPSSWKMERSGWYTFDFDDLLVNKSDDSSFEYAEKYFVLLSFGSESSVLPEANGKVWTRSCASRKNDH